jgi:hypothetical protein
MPADEVILFTTDKPDFYLLEQIYDSITNPTGTIIPRPNSIVLDPANGGLLRRVISVSPITNNSTYGSVLTELIVPPPAPTQPDLDDFVIDYGNSRFYLFYDKSETPTKLNVDKKVIVLGDDAKLYEIQRYDELIQRYVPISLYLDTDGSFHGTKIPLVPIETANDAKVPTNCHTSHPIQDGEVYQMVVYDYAGTQCGAFKLFAKRALINNTLDDNLIIEDFVIEATQQDHDGSLYVFADQDPDALVITPQLVYNNGTQRGLSIDNETCYLYGLEQFIAAYPGQTVDILVKYFLAPNQQASGQSLFNSGNVRYLLRQTKLVVRDIGSNEYSVKLLVVPVYLPAVSRWTLMFYLYNLRDNTVLNVTQHVTMTTFDGRLMGIDQPLVLSLVMKKIFPEATPTYVYQQPVIIKLAPYDYYERYIIRDTIGDTYGVFGTDSPILPRPVLHYDPLVSKYFVPTTKFPNENVFLEAFYYKIRPLFDSAWLTEPITPSHFVLRDAVNGTLLTSAPIAVQSYEQGFSIVDIDQPNRLLGTNCIVEFLKYEGNQQYKVLFGAPVDVYQGTYTH